MTWISKSLSEKGTWYVCICAKQLHGPIWSEIRCTSRRNDVTFAMKLFCVNKYLPPSNEVWGKVIFSQASAILSTGGEGWLASQQCITGHMTGGVCIWGRGPASGGTASGGGGGSASRGVGRAPQIHGILRDTVNKRVIRILLECFLENAHNEVGTRSCFYMCLWFCSQGGYPSMHCRWYPSMPFSRSPGGYPSMPCRFPGPHPGGEVEESGWGGGLQAQTQGEVEGSGLGGLQAHTWGSGVFRPTPRGVFRQTPGGSPGPHLGVHPSMHWGRPPWRLLPRAVRILLECILVFRESLPAPNHPPARSVLLILRGQKTGEITSRGFYIFVLQVRKKRSLWRYNEEEGIRNNLSIANSNKTEIDSGTIWWNNMIIIPVSSVARNNRQQETGTGLRSNHTCDLLNYTVLRLRELIIE